MIRNVSGYGSPPARGRQQGGLCLVSRAPSPLLACARRLVDVVRDVDMASDVGEVILKVVAQPIGEGLRAFADTAFDLIERKRLHCGNFRRIGTRLAGQAPEEHIDVFVLLHAVIEIGAIAAEESERQCRGDAELLMQPPAGRRDRALARTRMAAAGVRPQSARVIFLAVALLQHDLSLRISEEDREGAMQETLAVDQVLAVGADGMVAFVNQDQLLVSHLGVIWRAAHAFRAASFATLARSASIRLSRLTTKRVWVPALIRSISSLAATSNTTLRRSTTVTVTVISTVEPMRVAARCLSATSTPTESSPSSLCSIMILRQVISTSLISRGVA